MSEEVSSSYLTRLEARGEGEGRKGINGPWLVSSCSVYACGSDRKETGCTLLTCKIWEFKEGPWTSLHCPCTMYACVSFCALNVCC